MSNQPQTLFGALNRREFIRRSGGCAALSSISVLSTLDESAFDRFRLGGPGNEWELQGDGLFVHVRRKRFTQPAGAVQPWGIRRLRDIRQGLHYDIEPPTVSPCLARTIWSTSDLHWGMSLKPISPKSTSPNAGREFGIHGYFNANRNEPRYKSTDTIPTGYAVGDIIPAGEPGSNLINVGEDYMRDLYNAGNLSFVCNVGSLVNPDTNKANWRSFVPVGLFSHTDEQRNWMTAMPDTQSQNIGFLGRTADMLTDTVNQNSKIAMNIAMDNFNTMMSGEHAAVYHHR